MTVGGIEERKARGPGGICLGLTDASKGDAIPEEVHHPKAETLHPRVQAGGGPVLGRGLPTKFDSNPNFFSWNAGWDRRRALTTAPSPGIVFPETRRPPAVPGATVLTRPRPDRIRCGASTLGWLADLVS